MASVGRLMRELRDARACKDTDISLSCEEDQMYKWNARITGPPDTPFAGGVFHVVLRVASDYPLVPPTATFLTKVFHPNVKFDTGEICLDILKSAWTPVWTLTSVCRAIHSLMAHPEASSPLNCDAGNMLREGDELAFRSVARYYAVSEAGAPAPSYS